MSPEAIAAVVAEIDAIDASDPERAHSDLDDILYALAPAEVQEAAKRLFGRCRWWACA